MFKYLKDGDVLASNKGSLRVTRQDRGVLLSCTISGKGLLFHDWMIHTLKEGKNVNTKTVQTSSKKCHVVIGGVTHLLQRDDLLRLQRVKRTTTAEHHNGRIMVQVGTI